MEIITSFYKLNKIIDREVNNQLENKFILNVIKIYLSNITL